MPRLPTMRVIGSHAISTRSVFWPVLCFGAVAVMARPLSERGGLVAVLELTPLPPPLRFLVDGLGRDVAQFADDHPVGTARGAGDLAAGRGVHERHELVREAGHRAADADAADVGAAPDTVDPAALGDVALDDRAPAPELHQALGGAVLGRELALLVVAATVTALGHGHD